MRHVELTERFKNIRIEVELGFDPEQTASEVERCLNCDVQTVFSAKDCIECDACMDVCPVYCLTITDNGDEADLRTRLRAPWLKMKTSVSIVACAQNVAPLVPGICVNQN